MKTANLNRNKFLNNLLNIFTLFCQKKIALHCIKLMLSPLNINNLLNKI